MDGDDSRDHEDQLLSKVNLDTVYNKWKRSLLMLHVNMSSTLHSTTWPQAATANLLHDNDTVRPEARRRKM